MGNKFFYGILGVLAIGVVAVIVVSNSSNDSNGGANAQLLGTEHADLGRDHVADGTRVNYNSNPPTSGSHYASPISAGFYEDEVPDGNLVHNLEHGYVWVSYRPDLPADQIQKLKGLLSSPFSNAEFTPTKAVVTKREANSSPISLASWRYTLDLSSYDEAKIIDFYKQHIGKAPEGGAQ
ncbi:DUF3105 domain-containing protein [Candidatus Saccharibacteria bacterium]|nr:DUF3105 domain-containing protein [Candidatus Saccharibacteria bacterium]